jgi:hypothetical protein
MKYFETKHEKDSAKITVLFAVILILFIFIVGPKYMDPPLEYGIAVNFGTTDYGNGNIQPKKPIKSEVKEVIKQPEVVESQPEASKPQEANEDVVTQNNEESIALKKKKEAEAKARAEAKAEAERIAKEKRELEEKKKKLDALIGGIGKSDGTDTGSEGDDNQAGDKGQLDGDPYAPSYFGEPGLGGGGAGYGLRGRGKPTKSKVIPECDEEGSVVVEIQVNRDGRVVNAVPGKRGTTGNICLYDAAKKTALTYKWPADSKAPSRQIGFVVINFSVSQ